MKEAAERTTPVDQEALTEAVQTQSKQLYYVLSMLCKKKVLRILKKVKSLTLEF